MNKFEFISSILDNQKMNASQKERFLKLASKEIGVEKHSNEELWKEIDIIKKQLLVPDESSAAITFIDYDNEEVEVVKPKDYKGVDVESLLGKVKKNENIEIDNFLDKDTNSNIKYSNDENAPEKNKLKILKKDALLKPNENVNEGEELSFKISIRKKKYHDPNKVNTWLKYFTADNTAVKFSTHVWDDNLFATYQDYIDKLNDEYLKYDFHSLQKYNSDLYWNKIYPFLFQKKLTSIQTSGEKEFGWGRYKVAIGWQYPFLIKDFCEENFDNKGYQAKTPHTLVLPTELMPKDVPGKTIKTFENLVDLFKPEIEFRENQLWVGVKTALKKYLPNHDVDLASLNKLKGCSFFTNTEYVLKAISRIFNMIKSRSESQDLSISCVFDSDTNQYILEILHLNSYSDMYISHPKLIADNNGDLSILRTTLLSLCDFSIESRFKDKNGDSISARIDYLYDNVEANEWKPKVVTNDTNPGGFKFILKFFV